MPADDSRVRDLCGIERHLFGLSGVRDCIVRTRTDLAGRVRIIAYVAASPPVSREAVDSLLQATPDIPVPDDIVNLHSLPLDATGVPDEVALAALPVPDDEAAARLRELVRGLQGDAPFDVTREWSALTPVPMHPGKRSPEMRAPRTVPGGRGGAESAAQEADAQSSVARGPPIDCGNTRFASLADLLLQAAATRSKQCVTCVDFDCETTLTYAELRERAERVMAGLRAAQIHAGDTVVFLFESNLDFLSAFWGCIFAGVVPAPLAVPAVDDPGSAAAAKLHNVADLLGSPRILTSSKHEPKVRALLAAFGREAIEVIALESLLGSATTNAAVHRSRQDDLALLLLTSGSTGVPKAVTQTHGALIAAAHSIAQQAGLTSEDVCLNWISLEHVGGIVMCHLVFVALGSRQTQVRTDYLLQSPLRWLDLIDRFNATFTWAPNFAFALINDRAEELAVGKWNLKSMRFIVNGGEAVVARTARRFLRLLAPHGLPPEAIRPAWGMSETSSAAMFSSRFRVESTRYEDELVEVGPPNPGFEVRVVDEHEVVVPAGVEGRLQVRGANVTRGYLNNPVANAESFTADGWFRTGDLAILRNHNVTISGREKGVIIVNGVNHYAHEIEAAVEDVAGVTATFTAAFAVRMPRAQTDELAVAFHAVHSSDASLQAIVRAIRTAVLKRAGIAPRVILPLSKDQIPKTDIGKIQRTQLARRFAAGEFAQSLHRVESLAPASQAGPDWFFRTIWQRRELRFSNQIGPGCVLVTCGVPPELARELEVCTRAAGARLIAVDSAQSGALSQALQAVGPDARLVLVCPGQPKSDVAQSDETAAALVSVGAAVTLVQAVGRRTQRTELLFFDSEVQLVGPSDRGSAAGGSLLGLLRTVAVEYPQLKVRHVDLDGRAWRDHALLARRLIAEAADMGDEPEVAWRDESRFVRRLAPDSSMSHRSGSDRLTLDGFFLVTGGLGGIGSELCRYLLRNSDSPLMIIGRRSLDDPAARRVFESLEQLGQVRYQALDLAEASACLSALAEMEREFRKPLGGIFHLAGEYEPRMISEETPATLAATFRGKVDGASTARQILLGHPNAALYAFSSVNGAMGGFAAGAYSAANAFLDTLAREQALRGRACYSLAWSMWHEVGMSGRFAQRDGASRLGYLPLSVKQGLQSLAMIIESAAGHVLIGLDGKNPIVRQQLSGASTVEGFGLYVSGPAQLGGTAFDELHDRFGTRIPVQIHDRSDGVASARQLKSTQANEGAPEPGSEVARIIAEVWIEVLQRDVINPDENFFDLGGNSVLLASASHRLSERLKRQTAVTDIFRFPTLRQLAAHYNAENGDAQVVLGNSQDRGLARRARRQQRRSQTL